MKKYILLALLAIALTGCKTKSSPIPVITAPQWDAAIERLLNSPEATSDTTTLHALIIDCTNTQTVAKTIVSKGYEATIINDSTIATHVPTSYITTLITLKEVKYINGPRQMHPVQRHIQPVQ